MSRVFPSIIVMILLFLGTVPLNVDAEVGGRYATSIDLSPDEVGTGGQLTIKAYVTGTQLWDSELTTKYNIFAESINDETYSIAENLEEVEGMITFVWQVPETIPTGVFQICVEETDGEDVDCEWTSIVRYNIEISTNHEIILPDETLRVWAYVSSPIDGAPEIPESAGWMISYYTTSAGEHIKSGVLSPDSSNMFAILMPSNLDTDHDISVNFWANDSSGTQVSVDSFTVGVGHVSTSISSPYSGQMIGLGEDFLFVASCKRMDGWDWMPEISLDLTLSLKQDDHSVPVSISTTLDGQPTSLFSDGDGIVSLLMTLPNVSFEAGYAELVLFWTDSTSGEMVNITRSIILSEISFENLEGVGIELEIKGPMTSSHPGDDVILEIMTFDHAGNPLPETWVHHIVERTTNVNSESIADRGEWKMEQTDSQGKLSVVVHIPEDLRVGDGHVSLVAVARNATGDSDTEFHSINLLEPQISIHPTILNWLPGDRVEININSNEMNGEVAVFWEVSQLGLSGHLTFQASQGGSFNFDVPERSEETSLSVVVSAIDEGGSIDTDYFYLQRLNGYTLMVSPPDETVVAGETAQFNYILDPMDTEVAIDFPMTWSMMISGSADSEKIGSIDSKTGSFTYEVPSDLQSGSYIFMFDFGEQATALVVDVRSEEDASGMGGSMNSLGDSLDDASGWTSILALILGLVCVLMLLLRRRGEDGGPLESPMQDFTPSPSVQVPPPIAVPQETLPAQQFVPQPAAIPPAGMQAYNQLPAGGYPPPPQQQF